MEHPFYTLVCWGYCSTSGPAWSSLAYGVAFLGVGATYLAPGRERARGFGLLAFPRGVPVPFDAYRRRAA